MNRQKKLEDLSWSGMFYIWLHLFIYFLSRFIGRQKEPSDKQIFVNWAMRSAHCFTFKWLYNVSQFHSVIPWYSCCRQKLKLIACYWMIIVAAFLCLITIEFSAVMISAHTIHHQTRLSATDSFQVSTHILTGFRSCCRHLCITEASVLQEMTLQWAPYIRCLLKCTHPECGLCDLASTLLLEEGNYVRHVGLVQDVLVQHMVSPERGGVSVA